MFQWLTDRQIVPPHTNTKKMMMMIMKTIVSSVHPVFAIFYAVFETRLLLLNMCNMIFDFDAVFKTRLLPPLLPPKVCFFVVCPLLLLIHPHSSFLLVAHSYIVWLHYTLL